MSVNPTQSWANQNTALFVLINASTIKTGNLQANTVSTGTLYAGQGLFSTIDTNEITLDQASLTVQNGNELLLNGIPIATTQNLSSIADWAIDPAISTINANYNDIISVNRLFVSSVYANDVFSNRLNVNQAFISDLTVYQQTTENFASTISLEARNIICSTISIAEGSSAVDIFARNVYTSTLTTGTITGLTNLTQSASNNLSLTAGNGISITASNLATILGEDGINLNTSFGDINIRAPSSNTFFNDNVNMSGGNINLNADEGARVDLFTDINLTAGNGNRGRINLVANGGFNNGVFGEVNLTANGGSVGGVGSGGLITLTANTPLGTPSNLTSAIKINAASCLVYSGLFAPIGSAAGFTYIYGTGGNSIVAGLIPPILPQVPGTNYIYGQFGTTIANDLYTDRILPSYTVFGNDLEIRGRVLPVVSGVRLSNVKSISMDSPGLISGVGCNTGGDLSYSNGYFNNMRTNYGVIGELTGLPLYNSFISGFSNITCSNLNISSINNAVYPPTGGGGGVVSTVATASISSLTVSSINGSPYTPGGGGGSVVSSFNTASISSLNVSSINNYVSFVSDIFTEGVVIKSNLPPSLLLENTDITSQQTGLLMVANDNNSLIKSYNTSNFSSVNMFFNADNFGFNLDNITGGIEMDISGNVQIQHGSLTVSSIVGLQQINNSQLFVFGEFLLLQTQTVAAANTPTTILLDTTVIANGMILSGGLIEVQYSGVYRYDISIQLDKSGGGLDVCDFWITVNGLAVANTASQITVQGQDGEVLGNCQYYLSLFANDVIGIVFASPEPSMAATYFPLWLSPPNPYERPAIPAVIAQIQLIK